MKVCELCEALSAKALVLPEPEREIEGAYVGDLLSWVMGRAEEKNVWVTIMSNVNVIAVASLAAVSCVVFAEGVIHDVDVIKRAETEGINLLSVESAAFETCAKISGLI